MRKFYTILQYNKKLLVYLPLVIYWFVLLIATSLPSNAVPSIGVHDKFEHFFAYFILAVLLSLTLHFQNRWNNIKRNWLKWTLTFGIIYGAVDEFHQIFIPGRFCEFFDLLSNTLGVLFGIFLVKMFIKKSVTNIE